GCLAPGEHGPDRRPDEGAARLVGHRDHQGPPEAPEGGGGAARRGLDATGGRPRPSTGALGRDRSAAGRGLHRLGARGGRASPRRRSRLGLSAPILASSCARAATAAEARYRIDRPIAGRSARVIALDDAAADVVRRVAELPWGESRFFPDAATFDAEHDLIDADVAIMVATADARAETAASIARACAGRGIMTAGIVLGDRLEVGEAVAALRPYARNLMS